MATTTTSQSPPPALPAHVVSFLLSYLSPFDRPLPSHLLSGSLRQRQHFLDLPNALDTPRDVAAYLSWPSSAASDSETLRLVDLLGALPSPENLDPLVVYPTKYSYDGEAVYAHAQVTVLNINGNGSDRLRLIFRWDAEDSENIMQDQDGNPTNTDGWKYHDVKPTPFPLDSHDSPQAALKFAANLASHSASAQALLHHTSVLMPSLNSVGIDYDSDGAYWDSYGRSDDDGQVYNISHSIAAHGETDDEKAEDAYWDQYASVHGSADSTRPSPLSQKRKLHEPSSSTASINADARRTDSYVTFGLDVKHIDLRHLSGLRDDLSPGTPSPEVLTRRLYTLSPRASPGPSPILSEFAHTNVVDADTKFSSFDSSEPPQISDGLTLMLPVHSQTGTISSDSDSAEIISPCPQLPPILSFSGLSEDKGNDAEAGLRDAIKGMYCLWSLMHKDHAITPDTIDQKDTFLRVVRDVVYGL
ncbi:hypothetical protein EW145_g3751 [Phellinidium pouzarii]|uniref:Uncharacterized protein n=1 Tax=Phellinidium pouzarii TaxID=167371 RepID=A0A4S4L601_9AGAM|nr:hypothetical protein EW145_g3751 [Phellinidium pouzarii]